VTLQLHFRYANEAHWLFESAAYFTGFRVYLRLRDRSGDVVSTEQRWWVIAASVAGAALGSKALNWLADPALFLRNWNDPYFLMSGKTLVGGLIGGLFAVEWAKRMIGVRRRTGDLFAIPLCVGIAIGRVGCFLAGLRDDTYGVATGLPWGVDFGDGVARHPTQLYEALWMGMLSLWLRRLSQKPHRVGDLFKTFMVAYFAFRLVVDFIKPGTPLGIPMIQLTAIQWACAAMLIYYARDLPYLIGFRKANVND
jgi:prolipoprotein diacylglyceryltransferase